jgi:hypothetical protein
MDTFKPGLIYYPTLVVELDAVVVVDMSDVVVGLIYYPTLVVVLDAVVVVDMSDVVVGLIYYPVHSERQRLL